jgi:hypothetical protein
MNDSFSNALTVHLSETADALRSCWILAIDSPDSPLFACSSLEEVRSVVAQMARLAQGQDQRLDVLVRFADAMAWMRQTV